MMHGFGFSIYGFIGMILFWGLLIGATVLIIKALFSGRNYTSHRQEDLGNRAIDILNRRYASGEINREEYEIMKADLTQKD